MSRACTSKITSDDRPARNDRLATKNDILWARDGGSSRYLVPCILPRYSLVLLDDKHHESTYCLDKFGFRIVNRWLHVMYEVKRNTRAKPGYLFRSCCHVSPDSPSKPPSTTGDMPQGAAASGPLHSFPSLSVAKWYMPSITSKSSAINFHSLIR